MNKEYFNKIEELSKEQLIRELKHMNKEYETLQQENDFLRERENKLQMIEQMFKSKSVDLGDLCALVEGE